jgi:predicted site-specific integrase-resolvase
MSTPHLNQRQLAERWGISARTLERWRWIGRGPHFLKLGHRVAYRFADIEAFEAEQLRDSTTATPPSSPPRARSHARPA